jgi:hypothetical protein
MHFLTCFVKNFSTGLIMLVLAALNGQPVLAEPWHIATFEASKEKPFECSNCKDKWKDAIKQHIHAPKNGKIMRGHVIEIDLSEPKLEIMVTRRNTNGPCADHVGTISYTKPPVKGPLPVLLRTVDDWMQESGVTLAISGSNFHYDADKGVRAKLPCGEVIGVNLHDGYLDWPPTDKPELLNERVDSDPKWPADALLLYADRTAHVVSLENFDQVKKAAFGIGGLRLYTQNGGDNPNPGAKPAERAARLVIGVMPDRKHLLVLLVEGESQTKSIYERGVTLNLMRKIIKDLGAVDAINMDGSGSAQIIGPNGFATRPSDKEGARPIANHLGFRMATEEVTWTSYGTRTEQK